MRTGARGKEKAAALKLKYMERAEGGN